MLFDDLAQVHQGHKHQKQGRRSQHTHQQTRSQHPDMDSTAWNCAGPWPRPKRSPGQVRASTQIRRAHQTETREVS